MATTHVDRHNEQLARQGLDDLVQEIKSAYIPLLDQHDPRVPPRGRVVDAHIEQLQDGELAVVGVVEEFEPGDHLKFDPSRLMKIADASENPCVEFDRSFRDKRSQALIQDISELLGTKPQEKVKKALAPISVLTIAAKYVVGGIAAGVLTKVGEKGLDALTKKIALLVRRKRAQRKEYVFQFRSVVIVGGREVEVDILATSPSEEQIRRIFSEHLAAADKLLQSYLPSHPEIRRVVFDAGGRDLKFSFAVRADVVTTMEFPGA